MPHKSHLRFLSAGHFFHHYLLAILPVAAFPIETAWSLSHAQAIGLGTPMYVMIALATFPAGWLGDRMPRHWLMMICLFGSGLAAVLAGLSTGPLTLSLALALLGGFSAIYHPVGLAMVAEYARRTGPAFATNGVWGNFGAGIAAVMTAGIISAVHWRAAFILPGVVMLCLACGYTLACRPSTRPGKRADTVARNSAYVIGTKSILLLLFGFLALASVYDGLVAGGITYTLPRFLEHRALADSDLLLIGGSTSIVLTLASLGQLPSGWAVERYGAKSLLFWLFAGQVALLATAAVLSGPAVIAVMALFYLLLFAWFPLTAWLIGRHVPVRLHARAFSLEYCASLGTTAAAVPFVAWLYSLGIAPHHQLWIVAGSGLLVLAGVALVPRSRPTYEDKA